jgi:ribosomal RNA-processing protein 12
MESVGALSVGGKSQKTGKSKAKAEESGPRVKNVEKSGEVLDLLDDNRMHKHVQFSERYAGSDDDDDEDDGMMEFDANGRLVVHDAVIMMNEHSEDPAAIDEEEDDDSENAQIKDGSKRRRVSKFENVKEAKAMLHAKKNEEQRRKNQQERALGAAYKAKKAGGDVKKKGQQFEPYAYIPLERKNYTKKFRGKAVSQMATVVRNSGSKRKR